MLAVTSIKHKATEMVSISAQNIDNFLSRVIPRFAFMDLKKMQSWKTLNSYLSIISGGDRGSSTHSIPFDVVTPMACIMLEIKWLKLVSL